MAGETTSVAASAARVYYNNPGAGLVLGSTFNSDVWYDRQRGCRHHAGWLHRSERSRDLQVFWYPTDMDTGIAAVVHKVTVNSVDAVTGLTGAQTGTSSLNAVTSTFAATAPGTSPQLVKVTTTTAAATGAAGTAVLELICQKI
jgi:hypothetical protein